MRLSGKPLKLLRELNGLSTREAADIIGISDSLYRKAEGDVFPLTERNTRSFLNHLSISEPEAKRWVTNLKKIEGGRTE